MSKPMKLPFLGYKNGLFYFYCDYSDRDIPRRAGFGFDKDLKCWITPFSEYAAKLVKADAPDTWKELLQTVQEREKQAIELSHAISYDLNVPVPHGEKYLPYQLAGIKYMAHRRNVLLADQMGLGKTIEIVGLVNYLVSLNKAPESILVIVPSQGKINWFREWVRWSVKKYRLHLVYGIRGGWNSDANVHIINYDLLTSYQEEIMSKEWSILVIDECHYIKNSEAQRTQVVRGSSNWLKRKEGDTGIRARRKIAVTGTPIKNKARELYPIINYLLPHAWPRFVDYERRYCGWDGTGFSHTDELQRHLRATIMCRRLKKFVMPQLKPKVRQVIYFEPGSRISAVMKQDRVLWKKVLAEVGVKDEANLTEHEFRSVIKTLSGGGHIPFSEISRVRHETGLAKVPYVVNHLKDCLDSSEKVVCFCHHRDVAMELHAAFKKEAVYVIGGMGDKRRQIAIDDFMDKPDIRLFVGNIEAAGTVINLTVSSHVVFAELDWVPGNISQAEDRCHRVGTKDSVLVQHVVFPESIDAWMAQVIVYKQDRIDKTLDNEKDAEIAYILS